MCAHHVSQGSGDRNTRATLVATHAKVHASPEFMFSQSTCFPRVHVSPEFMLPQSSCVPRVHASPEFVQKVHASPEFRLPQGGVRFATVVASLLLHPPLPMTFFVCQWPVLMRSWFLMPLALPLALPLELRAAHRGMGTKKKGAGYLC